MMNKYGPSLMGGGIGTELEFDLQRFATVSNPYTFNLNQDYSSSANLTKKQNYMKGNIIIGMSGYDYGFKTRFYGSFDHSDKIDAIIYHPAHNDYEIIVNSGSGLDSMQICILTFCDLSANTLGTIELYRNRAIPLEFDSNRYQTFELDKYYMQTLIAKLDFS